MKKIMYEFMDKNLIENYINKVKEKNWKGTSIVLRYKLYMFLDRASIAMNERKVYFPLKVLQELREFLSRIKGKVLLEFTCEDTEKGLKVSSWRPHVHEKLSIQGRTACCEKCGLCIPIYWKVTRDNTGNYVYHEAFAIGECVSIHFER